MGTAQQQGGGRRPSVPALATESDARYRTLLEAAPDAIVVVDATGRIVVVNREAERMFGYSREQLVGELVEILLPERVRAAHRERRASFAGSPQVRAMSGGASFVARRADGREFPVEIALSPQGQLVTAIVRDVTTRTRAEQEQRFLADARAALAGSLDLPASLGKVAALAVMELADVCVVLRPRGAVTAATAVHAGDVALAARIRDMLQRWPLGPSRGAGLWRGLETGEPILIERVQDAWLERLSQSPEHLAELRALAMRSALLVPLRAQRRPFGALLLGRARGEFDRDHLAFAQELSTRCSLALENALLVQQTQRESDVRREFLSTVSHDLKNPLNAILLTAASQTRTLRGAKPEAIETALQQTQRIVESARWMDRLIHDLLDLARVEAGKLPLEPVDHAAAGLLEEVADLFAPQAAERSVRLGVRTPADELKIRGDRDRLLQVLSNLIGNALEVVDEGGSVTISVGREGSEVVFAVADDGPGIDAEKIPLLFDRYWRADPSHGRGTGLGLTIARGIVEAHSGRIWVQSVVGQGSTFWFALPVPEQ